MVRVTSSQAYKLHKPGKRKRKSRCKKDPLGPMPKWAGKAKGLRKKAGAILARTKGESYGIRNQNLGKLGFASYPDYLASDLWASIRRRAFAQNGGACVARCGRRANQLHHSSYSTAVLSGRDLGPLHPICRDCHQLIEFRADGSKRSMVEANQELGRLVCPPTVESKPHPPPPEKKPSQKPGRRKCNKCGQSRKAVNFRGEFCGLCWVNSKKGPAREKLCEGCGKHRKAKGFRGDRCGDCWNRSQSTRPDLGPSKAARTVKPVKLSVGINLAAFGRHRLD